MPCFTIKEISTNLAASNRELLIAALIAANYKILSQDETTITAANARHQIVIENGVITVRGQFLDTKEVEGIASKIKVGYANEVVKYAAKRYGFTRVQDKQNPAKATLKRKF